MTRYEPHCDCLGGHVTMVPDPNGRWCRADDPHPVADDPSGIVQQMPEVTTEALEKLLAEMTRGPWKFDGETTVVMDDDDVEPWICEVNFDGVLEHQADADARAIAMLPDLLAEVIARRATEADLRAEVERLRGLLWYAWNEFSAIRARSGAPLSHDGIPLVAEDWWNTMTEAFGAAIGDDAQTPWPSPEARAALYPETDGGQDG